YLVTLKGSERDQDDRHRSGSDRRRRTRRRVESPCFYPAPHARAPARSTLARAAFGLRDLSWIGQVECSIGRRGVSIASIDLQATQDDLLQLAGRPGHDSARWHRVPVESFAQLRSGERIAERKAPRGKMVEDSAEREDVAARIAAHADHLLRRHVHPVADRSTELLGEQIR